MLSITPNKCYNVFGGDYMDINKKIDLEFIKGFQKITLAAICKDLKVDKPSIYRGTASADAIKRVREEIEKRLDELKH